MPEIITRAEAKARGLKRYFTGVPCPRGHICARQCAGTGCVECVSYLKSRPRDQQRKCRCGTLFKPARANHVYCSTSCNRASHYAGVAAQVPVLKKLCPRCGIIFSTKSSIKIYCSRHCMKAATAENGKKRRLDEALPKDCVNCGSRFVSQYKRRITCSHQCYVFYNRWKQRSNIRSWNERNKDYIRAKIRDRERKQVIALRILTEAAKSDPKLNQLLGEINDAVK